MNLVKGNNLLSHSSVRFLGNAARGPRSVFDVQKNLNIIQNFASGDPALTYDEFKQRTESVRNAAFLTLGVVGTISLLTAKER